MVRSRPLQLFRESLPLPCFPCASFLFKSGLYSPSIAVSASKAAPASLAVAFSSCSPVWASSVRSIPNVSPYLGGPARGEVPFSY